MRTVNKEVLKMVERLARVNRARKECEKIEKQLKEDIKAIMGDDKILEAGVFSVVVQSRSRTDTDLERLRFSFGREMLKAYDRTTTYQVMEVLVNTIDVSVLKSLEFNI